MNNDIREISPQAKKALDKLVADEKNPFAILPPEWVAPVSYFAVMKISVLKPSGVLSLCADFKYWISLGLTLEDVKKILRMLATPDASAGHKWDNDLLAEIAQAVADVLRRRRMRADVERRKQADATVSDSERQVISLADAFAFKEEKA